MAGRNEALMRQAADSVRRFVVAGAVEFATGVVEINNEGADGAPPAPIASGELRSSVRATINETSRETSGEGPYTLTTREDVRRAVTLQGMSLGDVLWLTWIAQHAVIIEGGRRPDKNGRMIGSEQAPDGFVYPGVEVELVRMDRWDYEDSRVAS